MTAWLDIVLDDGTEPHCVPSQISKWYDNQRAKNKRLQQQASNNKPSVPVAGVRIAPPRIGAAASRPAELRERGEASGSGAERDHGDEGDHDQAASILLQATILQQNAAQQRQRQRDGAGARAAEEWRGARPQPPGPPDIGVARRSQAGSEGCRWAAGGLGFTAAAMKTEERETV